MDISNVSMQQTGENQVTLIGCRGLPRPDTLKTLACVEDGWIAEAEISFMGDTSLDRALLAQSILRERFDLIAPEASPHFDIIGAMYNEASDKKVRPRDVRLRMAAAADNRQELQHLLDEFEALYLNGPAGGGGIRMNISARMATVEGLVRQHEAVSRGYLLEETL